MHCATFVRRSNERLTVWKSLDYFVSTRLKIPTYNSAACSAICLFVTIRLLSGAEAVGMDDVVKVAKDCMDDYKNFLIRINLTKS